MTITKEWLEANMKGGVGINKGQCYALGISYPPPSKWKRNIIGKEISDEAAEAFCTAESGEDRFVRKYLTASEEKPYSLTIRIFLLDGRRCNPTHLYKIINRMKPSELRKTLYWKITTMKKDGCIFCGLPYQSIYILNVPLCRKCYKNYLSD